MQFFVEYKCAFQINSVNLLCSHARKLDNRDYFWCFKFKCNNCGEECDKWQFFNDQEEVELKGSRGVCHFILRCKFCSRENNLNVIQNSLKEYNAEDSQKLKTICEFECRGLEPTKFAPGKPWFAKGVESGTPFKLINLDEDDFADYDEKSNESVGIYEMKGSFVKLK